MDVTKNQDTISVLCSEICLLTYETRYVRCGKPITEGTPSNRAMTVVLVGGVNALDSFLECIAEARDV